jgi:hypothetical protein
MKNIISFSLFLLISITCLAQETYFTDAVEVFSRKKTAYIKLADGTDVEGTINRLKNKRGLVKELRIKLDDGTISTFLPRDIEHMYLPQSSFDKILEASKMEVTKWGKGDINEEKLKEGYAYFESTEVILSPKKSEVLLLQLVNPAFTNKVKVFFDPFAQETASASVGGVKLAGGHDKSYFLKVGSSPAYKLKKRDYKEKAEEIYGDCKPYWDKIKEDIEWSNFPEQLYMHAGACTE